MPDNVFEADLPDPEQTALDLAGQLGAMFGKYGSTKADPFVSKMEDLAAFGSTPEQLAATKLEQISAMAQEYGVAKAAPFLSTMTALQSTLPVEQRLPLDKLPSITQLTDPSVIEQVAMPEKLDETALGHLTKLPKPDDSVLAQIKTNLDKAPVSAATLTEQMNANKASIGDMSFCEIALLDETGLPLSGQAYSVTLPDGKIANGITDENGIAKVAGFTAGECKLCLPELDQSAW